MEQTDISRILALKGKVKGTVFQSDASYMKRHFGSDSLVKVEAKLKEWGQKLKYEDARAMEWYSAGTRIFSLLAIKEVFTLSDDDMFAMGLEGPKHSFIIKMLLKFFATVEKIFNAAPMVWRRHWDSGELELVEINEEHKRVVIRLKGIDLDPVFCKYEEGYFSGIMRLVMPGARASETKCTFRGDDCHEYTFTW
ncbi:MAG: hypothetical protein JW782_04415 [Candidatus Saganbacteria bacterium]|nr:hypothetical protein [Candidatus Saganbacteria bacterium]